MEPVHSSLAPLHRDFLLRPAELTRFAMDAFQTVQVRRVRM